MKNQAFHFSIVLCVLFCTVMSGNAAAQDDSLRAVLTFLEEDIHAVIGKAVRSGMLDEHEADSVLHVSSLHVEENTALRTKADLLMKTRQEWLDKLNSFYTKDIQAGYSDMVHSPSPSAILPRLLHIPREEDIQGPGAGRQPTVTEILARDRKLLLTRMINEQPEFLSNHPVALQILAIFMGLLNIGGAGNREMLVPSPKVGGKPQFDEMIFLDPNFDPRVYTISTPIPQYDPLDPSKPYKGNSAHRVNSSNAGSGAPPVQKSRYVIP